MILNNKKLPDFKEELNRQELFIAILYTILFALFVTAIVIAIWFLFPYSIIFVIAVIVLLPIVLTFADFR